MSTPNNLLYFSRLNYSDVFGGIITTEPLHVGEVLVMKVAIDRWYTEVFDNAMVGSGMTDI